MNDEKPRPHYKDMIEDVRSLSQDCNPSEEALMSIAISLRRLAEMFDDYRRR